MTALNEYDRLSTVLVKHVRDAFIDEATLAAQWKALNYTAKPDLGRAIDEYDRFIDILRSAGPTVHVLPRDIPTTLDSIYVRDASIVSRDRKSTRLNSSHLGISYAVFCLKKKKNIKNLIQSNEQ